MMPEKRFNRKQFRKILIDNSVNKEFNESIKEWELNRNWFCKGVGKDNGEFCICGHAIKEVCEVINRHNDKKLIIGNCCIEKFNIISEDVGDLIKVKGLLERDFLDYPLIRIAKKEELIDDWEYHFLTSIVNLDKRGFELSEKQKSVTARIFFRIKRNMIKGD